MHAGDSGHSICFPATGHEVLHHNRTSHWLYGWALSGKILYFYHIYFQIILHIHSGKVYTMWLCVINCIFHVCVCVCTCVRVYFTKSFLQKPMVGQDKRTTCCLCCEKGPVALRTQLERSAYVCGESIKLRASIDNQGEEEVRLKVKLIQVSLIDKNIHEQY